MNVFSYSAPKPVSKKGSGGQVTHMIPSQGVNQGAAQDHDPEFSTLNQHIEQELVNLNLHPSKRPDSNNSQKGKKKDGISHARAVSNQYNMGDRVAGEHQHLSHFKNPFINQLAGIRTSPDINIENNIDNTNADTFRAKVREEVRQADQDTPLDLDRMSNGIQNQDYFQETQDKALQDKDQDKEAQASKSPQLMCESKLEYVYHADGSFQLISGRPDECREQEHVTKRLCQFSQIRTVEVEKYDLMNSTSPQQRQQLQQESKNSNDLAQIQKILLRHNPLYKLDKTLNNKKSGQAIHDRGYKSFQARRSPGASAWLRRQAGYRTRSALSQTNKQAKPNKYTSMQPKTDNRSHPNQRSINKIKIKRIKITGSPINELRHHLISHQAHDQHQLAQAELTDTQDLPGERTVEESQRQEEKEAEMPKSRRSIMKKQVRTSHEDHIMSVSSQLKSDACDSPTRHKKQAFPVSIESRESKISKPEMNYMTESMEVNQLAAPQIECDDVDKTLERRRENTAVTALEGQYSALDRGGTLKLEGRRSANYKPGGSSLRPPEGALGVGDPFTVGITIQKNTSAANISGANIHLDDAYGPVNDYKQPINDLDLQFNQDDAELPQKFTSAGPNSDIAKYTVQSTLTNASLRKKVANQAKPSLEEQMQILRSNDHDVQTLTKLASQNNDDFLENPASSQKQWSKGTWSDAKINQGTNNQKRQSKMKKSDNNKAQDSTKNPSMDILNIKSMTLNVSESRATYNQMKLVNACTGVNTLTVHHDSIPDRMQKQEGALRQIQSKNQKCKCRKDKSAPNKLDHIYYFERQQEDKKYPFEEIFKDEKKTARQKNDRSKQRPRKRSMESVKHEQQNIDLLVVKSFSKAAAQTAEMPRKKSADKMMRRSGKSGKSDQLRRSEGRNTGKNTKMDGRTETPTSQTGHEVSFRLHELAQFDRQLPTVSPNTLENLKKNNNVFITSNSQELQIVGQDSNTVNDSIKQVKGQQLFKNENKNADKVIKIPDAQSPNENYNVSDLAQALQSNDASVAVSFELKNQLLKPSTISDCKGTEKTEHDKYHDRSTSNKASLQKMTSIPSSQEYHSNHKRLNLEGVSNQPRAGQSHGKNGPNVGADNIAVSPSNANYHGANATAVRSSKSLFRPQHQIQEQYVDPLKESMQLNNNQSTEYQAISCTDHTFQNEPHYFLNDKSIKVGKDRDLRGKQDNLDVRRKMQAHGCIKRKQQKFEESLKDIQHHMQRKKLLRVDENYGAKGLANQRKRQMMMKKQAIQKQILRKSLDISKCPPKSLTRAALLASKQHHVNWQYAQIILYNQRRQQMKNVQMDQPMDQAMPTAIQKENVATQMRESSSSFLNGFNDAANLDISRQQTFLSHDCAAQDPMGNQVLGSGDNMMRSSAERIYNCHTAALHGATSYNQENTNMGQHSPNRNVQTTLRGNADNTGGGTQKDSSPHEEKSPNNDFRHQKFPDLSKKGYIELIKKTPNVKVIFNETLDAQNNQTKGQQNTDDNENKDSKSPPKSRDSKKHPVNQIKLERNPSSSVNMSVQSPLRMTRDAKLDKVSQMRMSKMSKNEQPNSLNISLRSSFQQRGRNQRGLIAQSALGAILPEMLKDSNDNYLLNAKHLRIKSQGNQQKKMSKLAEIEEPITVGGVAAHSSELYIKNKKDHEYADEHDDALDNKVETNQDETGQGSTPKLIKSQLMHVQELFQFEDQKERERALEKERKLKEQKSNPAKMCSRLERSPPSSNVHAFRLSKDALSQKDEAPKRQASQANSENQGASASRGSVKLKVIGKQHGVKMTKDMMMKDRTSKQQRKYGLRRLKDQRKDGSAAAVPEQTPLQERSDHETPDDSKSRSNSKSSSLSGKNRSKLTIPGATNVRSTARASPKDDAQIGADGHGSAALDTGMITTMPFKRNASSKSVIVTQFDESRRTHQEQQKPRSHIGKRDTSPSKQSERLLTEQINDDMNIEYVNRTMEGESKSRRRASETNKKQASHGKSDDGLPADQKLQGRRAQRHGVNASQGAKADSSKSHLGADNRYGPIKNADLFGFDYDATPASTANMTSTIAQIPRHQIPNVLHRPHGSPPQNKEKLNTLQPKRGSKPDPQGWHPFRTDVVASSPDNKHKQGNDYGNLGSGGNANGANAPNIPTQSGLADRKSSAEQEAVHKHLIQKIKFNNEVYKTGELASMPVANVPQHLKQASKEFAVDRRSRQGQSNQTQWRPASTCSPNPNEVQRIISEMQAFENSQADMNMFDTDNEQMFKTEERADASLPQVKGKSCEILTYKVMQNGAQKLVIAEQKSEVSRQNLMSLRSKGMQSSKLAQVNINDQVQEELHPRNNRSSLVVNSGQQRIQNGQIVGIGLHPSLSGGVQQRFNVVISHQKKAQSMLRLRQKKAKLARSQRGGKPPNEDYAFEKELQTSNVASGDPAHSSDCTDTAPGLQHQLQATMEIKDSTRNESNQAQVSALLLPDHSNMSSRWQSQRMMHDKAEGRDRNNRASDFAEGEHDKTRKRSKERDSKSQPKTILRLSRHQSKFPTNYDEYDADVEKIIFQRRSTNQLTQDEVIHRLQRQGEINHRTQQNSAMTKDYDTNQTLNSSMEQNTFQELERQPKGIFVRSSVVKDEGVWDEHNYQKRIDRRNVLRSSQREDPKNHKSLSSSFICQPSQLPRPKTTLGTKMRQPREANGMPPSMNKPHVKTPFGNYITNSGHDESAIDGINPMVDPADTLNQSIGTQPSQLAQIQAVRLRNNQKRQRTATSNYDLKQQTQTTMRAITQMAFSREAHALKVKAASIMDRHNLRSQKQKIASQLHKIGSGQVKANDDGILKALSNTIDRASIQVDNQSINYKPSLIHELRRQTHVSSALGQYQFFDHRRTRSQLDHQRVDGRQSMRTGPSKHVTSYTRQVTHVRPIYESKLTQMQHEKVRQMGDALFPKDL